MKPDIFLLPVFDRILFLSPLQGITALLNRNAAQKIREAIVSSPGRDHLHREIGEIVRAIRTTAVDDPVSDCDHLQPAFLGFITTRACHGACRYCGFQPDVVTDKGMDLQLTADMIEWMSRTVRTLGKDTLEVHLFGGEPLLARETVDFIVHKTRSAAAKNDLSPHLEVTTNGVMDQERARWLGEYFQTVVLSLDGPQKVHDRHRPLRNGSGSWARAVSTAYQLRDSSAGLCLRCCVSNQNIDELEEIGRWMIEEFNPAVIDLETVMTTTESVCEGILAPDPYEFACRYLHLNAALSHQGVETVYSAAHLQGPRVTSCPVGRDTVIVTPEGLLSSCYLREGYCREQGQSCTIGHVSKEGIDIQMDEVKRLRSLIHHKPRCYRCFCRWTCAGGCHVNLTYPGCSMDYDSFCIQTRIITAASLLSRLGFDSWVERLVQDRGEMERLAQQVSDRMEQTVL
jgi:uncharacterized protein